MIRLSSDAKVGATPARLVGFVREAEQERTR